MDPTLYINVALMQTESMGRWKSSVKIKVADFNPNSVPAIIDMEFVKQTCRTSQTLC